LLIRGEITNFGIIFVSRCISYLLSSFLTVVLVL
jgi:hypothetical protein